MDAETTGLYSSVEITPSATCVDNTWFPALHFVFVSEFDEPDVSFLYAGTPDTLSQLRNLIKKAADAAALYCQQVQDTVE